MMTLNQARKEAKETIDFLKSIVNDKTRSIEERKEARADMIKHQIALLKSYK